MPFETALDDFARALADSALPAPTQTRGREGRTDARRFAVYRNNVAVGLIASLEMRYPVVRRLVGDDFFRGLARAFSAARKPATPVMIHYGVDFPDFVSAFAPAREIAYLGDVARFENAWVESYHAAEATPMSIADLAAMDPARLADLRFDFHPSVRLLRLAYPAASIWAAHQRPGEPRAPEAWAPEDALIARPHADVAARVLPPGGFDFALALGSGASLAEAAAPLTENGGDPIPHLIGFIEAGAIVNAR